MFQAVPFHSRGAGVGMTTEGPNLLLQPKQKPPGASRDSPARAKVWYEGSGAEACRDKELS